MRRAALELLVPFVFASACGGSPSGKPELVVSRFVDAPALVTAPAPGAPFVTFHAWLNGVPPAPRGPARAVIRDERHYTFARPSLTFVHHDARFVVPDTESFALEVGVPPDQGSCEELLAQVSLMTDEHDEHWTIGTCTGPPTARRLALRLAAPPRMRGKTADLWVHVRPVGEQRPVQRRFAIERVPEGARLQFTYGVEPAGWEPWASAATFHVLADRAIAPLFYARLDPARNPEQRHWYTASLDLERFAGKSLLLTLQTSLDRSKDRRGFSDPVWGDPVLLPRAPHAERRPWNVLLVSLDTLRARSLGAYGRERPTSPHFDALAREGTLFEHAIASASNTPPSHMTLFTGLYPSTHGVTGLATTPMADAHVTLAERLRTKGYATGAVTENGLLQADLGFERGFDHYRENKSADLTAQDGQIETTFRDAAEWLAAHRTMPFFLFVHTYQVHDPYTPPAGYRGLFAPAGATGVASDLDRYEEEIRYTDAKLAELWSQVGALGLADRTLLIVTSDHGEEFGEHGAVRHGANLYDESLAVPLLMRAPGLVPRGVRVPEQVGLLDVTPTILALLGLDPIANAQGLSLAPLLGVDAAARATLAATLNERRLFAEAWAPFRLLTDGSLDPGFHAPNYAQRAPDLKLIWAPAVPPTAARLQAYNLAADPRERDDLAASEPARFQAGRDALEAYAKGTQAAGLVAAPAPSAQDAATHEKLRALGYLR